MRLDVDGTCHRALRVLAETPSTMGEMREALALRGRDANKFQWPVSAMIEARLIYSVRGVYHLHDAGVEALVELDAGREWVVHAPAKPTVRVFDYQPRERAA